MLVVCLYQLGILIGLMGFICSIKSIVINKIYMKQSDWKHQQIVDPINLELTHKFEIEFTHNLIEQQSN